MRTTCCWLPAILCPCASTLNAGWIYSRLVKKIKTPLDPPILYSPREYKARPVNIQTILRFIDNNQMLIIKLTSLRLAKFALASERFLPWQGS